MRDPAIRVEQADWDRHGGELCRLRTSVFSGEQGIAESADIDGRDHECVHLRALDGEGRLIGTARLDSDGRIGRMAVAREWRDRGVGSTLLRELLQIAELRGHTRVRLHAQAMAGKSS